MEDTKYICGGCLEWVVPEYRNNGIHIGAFCPLCGSWIKWIPKEEAKKLNITDLPKNEPLF